MRDTPYIPANLKYVLFVGEVHEQPYRRRWPIWVRVPIIIVGSGFGWAAVLAFVLAFRVAVS